MIKLGLLCALVLLAVPPALARPCGGVAAPCTVGGGTYLVRLPDAARSDVAMPLLLFVHGYKGSAEAILADPAIGPVAASAGMLLVAPQGLHATWSHVGSPSQARDDVAFLRAVAADARRRWPVDPRLIIAAGFSQGGSMVWDLACRSAEGFTAFLPFSGAFWGPLPEACPSGPVNLRHVYGQADPVVPMAGRAIRSSFRQGDLFRGLTIRRQIAGCPDQPDRSEQADNLTCHTWSSCSAAKLQLCLHAGGHEMEPAWLAEGLAWARGLTRR